jgi:hypothetical protein
MPSRGTPDGLWRSVAGLVAITSSVEIRPKVGRGA